MPSAMIAAGLHPAGARSRQVGLAVDLAIDLAANEPFLDDHRPGGQPLLGTAMGIELMSRAVRRMTAGNAAVPHAARHVAVLAPLILRGERATVHVHATRQVGSEGSFFLCVLESRPDGAATIPHFEATFLEATFLDTAGRSAAAVLPSGVALDAEPSAHSADVYALLFHGPAFRVVRSASLAGGGMLCEWQPDLPAWTHAPPDAAMPDPRWTELCLQAAGLLEIATTQRMLIPHRIASVLHCPPAGRQPPRRMFAHAKRAASGEAIDIDLVDQDRQPLLRVSGYETVPLPFDSSSAALQALARLFSAQ